MSNPTTIDYPGFLHEALRTVVRRVLERLAEIGPTGEAHILVTFRTDEVGTEMPAALRRQYPERMTIELQHQFWALETSDEGFGVLLSFEGRKAALQVPWSAVLGFADPEANFGLSFETPEVEPEPTTDREGAEIVPIDRFRRGRD